MGDEAQHADNADDRRLSFQSWLATCDRVINTAVKEGFAGKGPTPGMFNLARTRARHDYKGFAPLDTIDKFYDALRTLLDPLLDFEADNSKRAADLLVEFSQGQYPFSPSHKAPLTNSVQDKRNLPPPKIL